MSSQVQVEFVDDDDIYSYFNKSVSAVQVHADHFEQEYARPALRTSQAFFDQRPISATFVAIFLFLSVVPVVAFLGLALFFTTSFIIIALTATVIFSATVVLTLLSLLILTLLITFASAAFLTLTGISIFAFASLLNHVRLHGSSGVALWMDHMSDFVFGTFPVQVSQESADDESAFLSGRPCEPEWTDTEDPDQHEFGDVKEEELETSPSHQPSEPIESSARPAQPSV